MTPIPSFTLQQKSFLSLLNAYQVEYLIIGGHAVVYHGYWRPIADLDVWVATQPLNAQKLVAALHEFGPGLPSGAEAFFQLPERVIRLGEPPFLVEHFQHEGRFIHLGTQPPLLENMTSISGVEFRQCYPQRVTDYLDGVLVDLIGLTCLQANKKVSIRPKDADDYQHLMGERADRHSQKS